MPGLVPFQRGRSLLGSNRFDEFSSLLDEFFGDSTPRRGIWRDSFRLDVREDEKEYRIEAELPGIKKEDINLEAANERLRIRVQREELRDENEGDYIHRERRFGSMERTIHLLDMDEEQVAARCADGILYITVPKKEIGQHGKQIPIE